MTLDKVQYTAKAHTTGGRDGASRSAGVKQGDQGVLSSPVDLEDGSKVEIRATPTAKAASWLRLGHAREALFRSIHQDT